MEKSMTSWFKAKTRSAPSLLRTNVRTILSLLIAFYFMWAFHLHVGFPPRCPLTSTAGIYLGLFVLFALLPFAQRLRFGKFIEFEAKVEQVRADVKEVRTETRELISTLSTMVNTISTSVTNKNELNILTREEWLTGAETAKKDLSESLADTNSPESSEQERDINVIEYIEAGGSDVNYALAHLRMDLEGELRRILGEPSVASDDPFRRRGRATFLTARLLFRKLGLNKSRYTNMQRSFDYIMKACNEAIHGQQIPEPIAHQVIDMGLRILRELKDEAKLSG